MEFVNRVNQTEILYGNNKENDIGRIIKYLGGSRLLIVSLKDNSKIVGLLDKLKRSLKSAGIECIDLKIECSNPRIEIAFQAMTICHNENIDFVLAIGSYNEFSIAKAIAAGANYEDNFYNIFKKDCQIERALPIGIISTSACGGDAFNNSAVLSHKLEDGSLTFYTCKSSNLAPKFVIYSPELCSYDSRSIEQNIVRIVSLFIYRIFAKQKANLLVQNLSIAAIKTIISFLDTLDEDSDDPSAIENILVSSIFASISFVYNQKEDDTPSILAKAIVSVFDCDYEQALSLSTCAWLLYHLKDHALTYARLGKELFNLEYDFSDPLITAKQTVMEFNHLIKRLGFPTSFKDLNANCQDLEKVLYKLGFPEISKIDNQEGLDRAQCEVLLSLSI